MLMGERRSGPVASLVVDDGGEVITLTTILVAGGSELSTDTHHCQPDICCR
jgi:hypothetical protein